MRELLRVPRCPEPYHSLRGCVNTALTKAKFISFLSDLESADLIKKSNVRSLIKYSDPFLSGAPLQLGNGRTLTGDHTITLRDDLFAKLKQVRAFERANDDKGHGYISHVLGKIALLQLQEMGQWSIAGEQWKRRNITTNVPSKRKRQSIEVAQPVPAIPIGELRPTNHSDGLAMGDKDKPSPNDAVHGVALAPPIVASVTLVPPPPPPAFRQLARTCALDLGLHGWIGKRISKTQAREEVKKYYKRNPEQVEAMGLDPEYFSIDHVVPSHIGGIDHVFNYVLMPVGVNARFKDRWDNEKKKYVGHNAAKIASDFASWFRSRNASQEDFSKFDPHRCL